MWACVRALCVPRYFRRVLTISKRGRRLYALANVIADDGAVLYMNGVCCACRACGACVNVGACAWQRAGSCESSTGTTFALHAWARGKPVQHTWWLCPPLPLPPPCRGRSGVRTSEHAGTAPCVSPRSAFVGLAASRPPLWTYTPTHLVESRPLPPVGGCWRQAPTPPPSYSRNMHPLLRAHLSAPSARPFVRPHVCAPLCVGLDVSGCTFVCVCAYVHMCL